MTRNSILSALRRPLLALLCVFTSFTIVPSVFAADASLSTDTVNIAVGESGSWTGLVDELKAKNGNKYADGIN